MISPFPPSETPNPLISEAMSPGPVVDPPTEVVADQQLPSVDETTHKKKPLPLDHDAPVVEDVKDEADDDDDDDDDDEDDEEDGAQGLLSFFSFLFFCLSLT